MQAGRGLDTLDAVFTVLFALELGINAYAHWYGTALVSLARRA